MEEEDEDDIYAPDESILTGQKYSDHDEVVNGQASIKTKEPLNGPQDEESGEEIEEDESDSVLRIPVPSRC